MKIFLSVVLFFLTVVLFGQTVQKETRLFAEKEGQALKWIYTKVIWDRHKRNHVSCLSLVAALKMVAGTRNFIIPTSTILPRKDSL
ncbi:hypothetical protein SDC9_169336 [bioreactor metagenome]|uniref:Uncharacterized protein n=1 Tax=bioreactor metagenome TaxID=1076179 RepID=A0A645GD62_9ZZZZ